MPPSEFIRAAELSGLIVTLGDWAIDQVCRQLSVWREEGRNDISLAVNLSARQFATGDLPAVVRACLERHGVPPSMLILEITESLLMDQGQEASRVLAELREIGVHLALDDFGTGYSSLAYLRSLPVDMLKIDRVFIEKLDQSEVDRGVVATVIGMARIFGLTVVAEGVETQEQFAVLRELGCDRFQGFLFGRPQPAEALVTWTRATSN